MAADAHLEDEPLHESRDGEPAEPIDAAVYGDRQIEVRTDHNGAQTLVAVETQAGSAVAAVDVGHLPLGAEVQLARDVREAVDRATSAGGESGAE